MTLAEGLAFVPDCHPEEGRREDLIILFSKNTSLMLVFTFPFEPQLGGCIVLKNRCTWTNVCCSNRDRETVVKNRTSVSTLVKSGREPLKCRKRIDPFAS
jgi:hypothetical protein